MPLNIFDMIDSVMMRPRAPWQVPARRLDPAGRGALSMRRPASPVKELVVLKAR